jgi:hypothetical protein
LVIKVLVGGIERWVSRIVKEIGRLVEQVVDVIVRHFEMHLKTFAFLKFLFFLWQKNRLRFWSCGRTRLISDLSGDRLISSEQVGCVLC